MFFFFPGCPGCFCCAADNRTFKQVAAGQPFFFEGFGKPYFLENHQALKKSQTGRLVVDIVTIRNIFTSFRTPET